VVAKPRNVTFEQAAAVPVAGLTALQGLRNHGLLKRGQKVLVSHFSSTVLLSNRAKDAGLTSDRLLSVARIAFLLKRCRNLLRGERDQNAEDDDPHFAGELAPAMQRLG